MSRRWIFFPSGGVAVGDSTVSYDNQPGFPGGSYFSNDAYQSIGTGNLFSVSSWVRPQTVPTVTIPIIDMRADGTATDLMHLDMRTYVAEAGTIEFQLYDETGNDCYIGYWYGKLSANTWIHVLLTFDPNENAPAGTSPKMYLDGSLTAVDFGLDNDTPFDMNDAPRRIRVGANTSGGTRFDGNLGHIALWNSILSSDEVTEIYNGKFDINLRNNTGNYASSTNLLHYWRPGDSEIDMGKDYGNATPISISTDGVNLTTDDIVNEVPS